MGFARKISRRTRQVAEINITAFMNLMVVLVPFLLMTAVFTQITVFELNLPSTDSANNDNPEADELQLRVTIRQDALLLSDSRAGLIKRIDRNDQNSGYSQLHKILKQVKTRFPDKTEIVILSQADTPYNDLVQVMDASRSFSFVSEGQSVQAELFPDISIGDAPAAKGPAK